MDDTSSSHLSIKQTQLIDELQIQLTKLQIQCLEERRNYLDLVGDNEQLKLEREETQRKLQAALLMGKVDEKSVVHFLQNNPKAPALTDEIIKVNEDLRKAAGGKKRGKYQLENPLMLAKQVAALQAHLKDVKEQDLVEIFGLKTSLEITLEEREIMKTQYDGRIKEVVKKLEEANSLLHNANQENLKLKKKLLQMEDEKATTKRKLEAAEEAGFGMELGIGDVQKEIDFQATSAKRDNRYKHVPPVQAHLLEKLTRAEIKIMEKDNIIKEYEMKFIQMEKRLGRVKEEEDATKKTFGEMIRKLKAKNESISSRFEKLDERRRLDNAGFRQDIKMFRQLINTIQRKLYLFMHRRFLDQEQQQNQESEISAGSENKSQSATSHSAISASSHPPTPPERESCIKSRGKGKAKIEHSPEEIAKLNIKEQRRDSKEEMERDRIIYEMLCKLLDSASLKVNQIEKEIFENA